MPIYKNRPPMDSDTKVWRYFSLRSLLATARTKQLRFTRVDTFDDPFEGSVTKKEIDDQVVLFSSHYRNSTTNAILATHYPEMSAYTRERPEDPWLRVTRLRQAKRGSAHASCWAAGEESESLWRLYCTSDGPRGLGVAMQTTLERLEASLARHDLYISPVNYRHYHTGSGFTDELDPFMNKRRGFAAEQEVRLLKFDGAQFARLTPQGSVAPDLPEHLHLDWSILDSVEKLVLSPYADEVFEDATKHLLGNIDKDLLKLVDLSILHPRQYQPLF